MKILKKITRMAAIVGSVLAFSFAAYAADGDSVILKKNGTDGVKVSVGIGNAYKEQITGVSLALKVDVEKGKEKITFSFSNDLDDAETGSRYRDGYLYLYVTCDHGIFDQDDMLYLGELDAEASTNAGLKAVISFTDGSLESVNGVYSSKNVRPNEVSDPVTLSLTGSGNSNSSTDSGNSGSGSGHSSSSSSRYNKNQLNVSVPSYVVKGTWKQNGNQWIFVGSDGKEYKNCWAAVLNPYADTAAGQSAFDWFHFDVSGVMQTGWLTDTDGNRYYLNPVSDNTKGRMVTGWVWIPDAAGVSKCYYFNPVSDGFRGKLLTNTVIDGYTVNKDGAWTVNGVVQTR